MPRPTEDFAEEIAILGKAFGVKVAKETYEPNSFGNAIVLLRGPKMEIRILRERGRVFVDLAPRGHKPDKWVWTSTVLEKLGIRHEPTPAVPLAETVQVLASNAER